MRYVILKHDFKKDSLVFTVFFVLTNNNHDLYLQKKKLEKYLIFAINCIEL